MGPAHRVDQVGLAGDDVPHVGEVASSKSAMNTCAPELSALMIILRSTGPVISTRRSCRSAGGGETLHVFRAHALRLGEKVGPPAAVEALLRGAPSRETLGDLIAEPSRQIVDKRQRRRCQHTVRALDFGNSHRQYYLAISGVGS